MRGLRILRRVRGLGYSRGVRGGRRLRAPGWDWRLLWSWILRRWLGLRVLRLRLRLRVWRRLGVLRRLRVLGKLWL